MIRHHEKIDGTLVAGLYFRFKVEQMDKYPDIEQGGRMGYKPDWSAIAMYDTHHGKEELIGAIVFNLPKDTNGVHVCAAYIKPQYRGRGFYEDLWGYFVKTMQSYGRLYVDSSTHRENEEMVRLYEKQGRINMGTFWILPLKEPR